MFELFSSPSNNCGGKFSYFCYDKYTNTNLQVFSTNAHTIQFLHFVAGAISPRNNDDDNTINKGRNAVKQKTPSEREASSNN